MSSTIIVYGYIRSIDQLLSNNKQIIPYTIYDLCIKFYSFETILCYVIKSKYRRKADIILCNMQTKTNWTIEWDDYSPRCNNNIKKNRKCFNPFKLHQTSWFYDIISLILPHDIFKAINHKNIDNINLINTNKPQSYHIIFNSYTKKFKSIGINHKKPEIEYFLSAIMINDKDLSNLNNNNITSYDWNLPLLPCLNKSLILKPQTNMFSNNLIYSKNQQKLFSVYGNIDKIYELSFDSKCNEYINQNNWKWKCIATRNAVRKYAVSVLINDNINDNEKLFIVDHDEKSQIVELFDFNSNKFIKLKPANKYESRYSSGIYYDNRYQNVYLIGGYLRNQAPDPDNPINGVLNKYYNINQNKWYNLPDTNVSSYYSPVVWMEDFNLLYIASSFNNSMEYIDLRDHSSKWNLVCNKTLHQHFNLFSDIHTRLHSRAMLIA